MVSDAGEHVGGPRPGIDAATNDGDIAALRRGTERWLPAPGQARRQRRAIIRRMTACVAGQGCEALTLAT